MPPAPRGCRPTALSSEEFISRYHAKAIHVCTHPLAYTDLACPTSISCVGQMKSITRCLEPLICIYLVCNFWNFRQISGLLTAQTRGIPDKLCQTSTCINVLRTQRGTENTERELTYRIEVGSLEGSPVDAIFS